MSKYPNKSRSQIRQAIEESANDAGACGQNRMFGHGIVDIMSAAEYLENGPTAPESAGCVETTVSIRTDKFGSEISYVIRNSLNEIVWENGPYSNRQSTHMDAFQLPPDCYEFEILDSYGTVDHFKQAGEVVRAVVKSSDNGRSKGFGIARFARPEDAEAAISTLGGVELDGRPLEERPDRKA